MKRVQEAIIAAVVGMWMQISYPVFGWLIHRLDRFSLRNRTQALLAVGVTLLIQIGLLAGLVTLL